MTHLSDNDHAADAVKPFAALIGEWISEATHPMLPNTLIRGTVRFEWLEGECFLIWWARNEHRGVPDTLSIIGIMEDEERPSMQYFDSRGVHRIYGVDFDSVTLLICRETPGFSQRLEATLSSDGGTLSVTWQLNRDDQGYRDDLAFTFQR